jgi:hypothetical protein
MTILAIEKSSKGNFCFRIFARHHFLDFSDTSERILIGKNCENHGRVEIGNRKIFL